MSDVTVLAMSELPLPRKAHNDDAAYDLCSVQHASINPGARRMIYTGLNVAIPEGYAGLVLPRSGLAVKHGITVLNAPGLIDPGYRGEVGVVLLNTDRTCGFDIAPGDRIAQLLVVPVPDTTLARTTLGLPAARSGRGEGGFGSSGVA